MNNNDKNLIYLETYKDIEIYQYKDKDGLFGFDLDGEHSCFNIIKTKKLIDTIFNFTQEDYKRLLSKLNNVEKKFITDLVEELQHHFSSSWCDVDIDLPYYIDNF